MELEWEPIGSPREGSGSPRELGPGPDTSGAMLKNEAIVIIMSHGTMNVDLARNKGKYVSVPKCVTYFKKKSVAAPGYYSMLDLYYKMGQVDVLNDIIEKGLENSFPQMDDVRSTRVEQESVVMPSRREGWQTDVFGPVNMEGECSDGVCITHSKKKIVNKIYSPEGGLPLMFVYKFDSAIGPQRFNLFYPNNIIDLFEAIRKNKRITGQALEKMYALMSLFIANADRRQLTTYLIFELVKVLKIQKLSILDFSCAVPLGKTEPEPASYIPLPEDVGVGKNRNKTRRKKGKGKRKTRTIK
jgi:hypothetical protein